jgi:hypothetical protein
VRYNGAFAIPLDVLGANGGTIESVPASTPLTTTIPTSVATTPMPPPLAIAIERILPGNVSVDADVIFDGKPVTSVSCEFAPLVVPPTSAREPSVGLNAIAPFPRSVALEPSVASSACASNWYPVPTVVTLNASKSWGPRASAVIRKRPLESLLRLMRTIDRGTFGIVLRVYDEPEKGTAPPYWGGAFVSDVSATSAFGLPDAARPAVKATALELPPRIAMDCPSAISGAFDGDDVADGEADPFGAGVGGFFERSYGVPTGTIDPTFAPKTSCASV